MCRRTRLHLPGGFYYLCLERSKNEPPFFFTADDYLKFEKILAQSQRQCAMRVHAYCWERRAIRLIVQVGKIPTGKLMERQMVLYLRYLAQRYPDCHQVLNTRHKAILFDPEEYLLPFVRYLHWRPIVAQKSVVESSIGSPEGYRESSHRAYLGRAHKRWLTLRTVLWSLCRVSEMHCAYRRYVQVQPSAQEVDLLERGSYIDPRVLGGHHFLCRLPRDWPVHRSHVSIEDIIASVALLFGIDKSDIHPQAGGKDAVLIRAVIAWQVRQRKIAKLCDLAPMLGRKPNTLLEAIDRYQKLRPELFTLTAIRGAGPLVPSHVVQALIANKPTNVQDSTAAAHQPEGEYLTRLAS